MKNLLIVIFLAATVLVAGVLGYAGWKRLTASPQARSEQAKKYFDQAKYAEAAIEAQNALASDPRNRDSRLLMAHIYLKRGNVAGSVKELRTLMEYYPDDGEANLELANIYLAVGITQPDLIKQAQEIAKKLLAIDPNNVAALVVSGNASAIQKDYTTSIEALEKAARLDPKSTSALVSLGAAYMGEQNLTEAEKNFLKARNANPKDRSTVLSLANYYRAAGNLAKAEETLKEALSLDPADPQIYLPAVDFYVRAGRMDDVSKVLQAAQAKSAGPAPSLTLVSVYEQTGHPDDARKLLLDLKTKFPKDLDVAVKLATNLLHDQPERARTEIDQVVKAAPQNPVGHVLLGEYQFQAGQVDAAAATLSKEPALNSPFPEVHYTLGNIALRRGQLDEAIDHYLKSLGINKGYVPAKLALAEAFLNKGRQADAKTEIDGALQIQPGNLPARLLKTTLEMADKKYSEVDQELKSLAKDYPENDAVQRQTGLYHELRGNTAEAEKSLIRAVDLAPNTEDNLRALVLFYVRNKQTNRALEKLNSVPDDRKQAFHYELMGAVASREGKLGDAENAYKKALEKDPNRFSSEQLLLDMYVQSKRLDEALKVLDARIKKNPANSAAFTMRGSLYEQMGNLQEAQHSYEQALQADPNQDAAANNLAYLLAEQGGDLQKALQLAQTVRKNHPEDPSIADTLAWVYYKQGLFVLARDSEQFAASKRPDSPVFQYHLGLIYKANNQRPEAEAALKKALSAKTDFKEKSQADTALKELQRGNQRQ